LLIRGLDYVIDHGIVTEEKYPYKGRKEECQVESGDFKIKAYKKIR